MRTHGDNLGRPIYQCDIDRGPPCVGHATSIAIDHAGRIQIAYYDSARKQIKFAIRQTPTATWYTFPVVTSGFDPFGTTNTDHGLWYVTTLRGTSRAQQIVAGDLGFYPAMALTRTGKVRIAYYALGSLYLAWEGPFRAPLR